MKYVKKKIIKGQGYYYFEYYLGLKEKKTYTKYLGKYLPENIIDKMREYFMEISKIVVRSLDVKYFYSLNSIEQSRFKYILLNHELLEKDFQFFKTLFYILFVLNSNRSEGSKVTQADIERVISSSIKPKTTIEKEIVNSIKAINFSFSDEMKWDVKSIKEIHKYLFWDIYSDFAGQFKRVNNVVNNSSTIDWRDVNKEMKKLMLWFNKNRNKTYPPQLALEFHWRLENIHPFQDGNGRVGRILLNAFLVQQGYSPVIYFTDNHKTYCNAIQKAINGHTTPLAEHYVKSVKKTEKAIEEYKKNGVIRGGSAKVGKWEIQKDKIRMY